MKKQSATTCSRCAKLQQANQELQERVQHLEQTVQQLQKHLAAAKKDSSTSSKPPSSDIVKPTPRATDTDEPKRSIGGQPGHPPHFRAPYTAEEVTRTLPHRLTHCP